MSKPWIRGGARAFLKGTPGLHGGRKERAPRPDQSGTGEAERGKAREAGWDQIFLGLKSGLGELAVAPGVWGAMGGFGAQK